MVAADLLRVGDRRYVFDERTQAVLGLLEKPLRLLPLRDVLRDLRETPQSALIVVQRRYDRIGPEPRSVLAHMPVLLLEPDFSHCLLQLFLRPATPGVFFGEEH